MKQTKQTRVDRTAWLDRLNRTHEAQLQTARADAERARANSRLVMVAAASFVAELAELAKAVEHEVAARAQAEAKLQDVQDRVEVREVDTMVRKILPKFVDGSDDSMEFAMFQLKRHVAGLDDDDLNDPEKVVTSWAKEFAKKYPKHARRTTRARRSPKRKAART